MVSLKQHFFPAAAAVAALIFAFLCGYNFPTLRASASYVLHKDSSGPTERHLHVLLPVTSKGPHLCRLLISAGIAGYPDPVFVGWNGSGIYNGQKTHLFKITETLLYLDRLPKSMDDDLFLMLDAFDIVLQLRPDVLIPRYYSLLEKSDARLKEQGILGKLHRGSKIKNTIVFGPDKSCSPQESNQAACWAIPQSPLPENWAGSHTDTSTFTNRGRFLNSGTIMGPVRDVRAMFRATFDMISWEFEDGGSLISDQYYFGEVWGEQEVERTRLRDGNKSEKAFTKVKDHIVPHPAEGKRTEYHITLDYTTDIFQTASGYDRHITWMSHNHSTPKSPDSLQRTIPRIDEFTLPKDILNSEPPYAAIEPLNIAPTGKTWSDMMLGTMVLKHDPFPIIHVTGNKWLRDRWWTWMWFHPYAEPLHRETRWRQRRSDEPDVFATIDGVKWSAVHREEPETNGTEPKIPGGAWTSHGEFIPFEDLCGEWGKLYDGTY